MSDRRPLEILMTTRAPGDGGAERVWATIARGLAARGDRVTLAVDRAGRGFAATDADVAVEVIGEHFGAGILHLARLLRHGRPQIALAATSGSCSKLAIAALLARSGTPLVLSYHGFEEYKTGKLAAAAYWGMPVLNRLSSRIVAVSDALKDELVGRWGAAPAKTRRIYNPVEMDFAGAAAGAGDLATRRPAILAVGRLSREKGMDDLVRAFARVARPDAHLTLLGDGPDRAALTALIGELGLGGRVEIVGWHEDPTAYYRAARLVVVPSRTEAFGMVVVEALAHGLPIVSTTCGGPAEILAGGRFGQLVGIGDVAAMAAAIETALDRPGDPAERIRRAEAFSAEIGIAGWSALIDEVVAERAERAARRLAAARG